MLTGKYEGVLEMMWVEAVILANNMLWDSADYHCIDR
jgi:hypothetical protein